MFGITDYRGCRDCRGCRDYRDYRDGDAPEEREREGMIVYS